MATEYDDLKKDIVARKSAEATVREGQQLMRLVLETLPVGVAVTDRAGNIVLINDASKRIWGGAIASGRERWKQTKGYWHDSGERIEPTNWASVRALSKGETSLNELVDVETYDGQRKIIRNSAAPIRNAEGVIVGAVIVNEDVTDRVRAEEAVRRSEDELGLVIDTIPVMAWSVRPDGVVDFLNQRWLDYTGVSLEEAIKDPTGAVHPEDLSRVLEKWRATMEAGEPYEDEMRLRGADGKYCWFLIRTAPLRDEHGNIVKWFGSSIDIEDRKLAEDALRQSEERFAAFMDNLPGYAWMKDLQGRYVYVNEMVRGLPGYRSIGKTDAQIWPADLAAEYRANDQQVIAAKKPFHTLEHFQQEGKQRYMAGSKFAIFDKTGAVALVGGVGVDITERIEAEVALRESEQRFRTLLEAMPVAVYVCDTSGRLQQYNHRAAELWGRAPKLEDPRQRYCGSLRLYSPEGELVPHQKSPVAEVLRTGIEARDQEVIVERPDGSRITVLASIVPLKNGDGELIGAMNCFQDITERKQAAKELEEAHRQLQILSQRRVKVQEEERRHLARELHDEIGQALTAAKINLQAAMKESDGAQSKRIDETAAILERLLGQVRQISLDLRPSTLDDLGLVPALRSLLDQQGRSASVAVHFSAKNVPENLDPEIQTTCFRIAQEAITNAVRHANATRIDVNLRRENGNLKLQVRDNGRGFDAESAQAQAAGLGLIGIKERAALVNARAKIISSPNKGTTVDISLPLTSSPQWKSRTNGK